MAKQEMMKDAKRLYYIGEKSLAYWTAKPAIDESITEA